MIKGGVFPLIKLHMLQNRAQRRNKIPFYYRHIRYLRNNLNGHILRQHKLKLFLYVSLAFPAACVVIEKDVQGKLVLVFGVNAVCCKAAAKSV